MSAVVVYVHGLWMPGTEALLLRWRLERDRGYRLRAFQYDSARQPMTQIGAALRDTVAAIDAPQVHLVGHSLGGLVILHCLERYPMAQPGRVVFLGSPMRGSRAAQRLARSRLGRCLLGLPAAEELLVPRARRWDLARELGIVAGTLSLGFGRLLQLRFGEDNDGTVAVSETRVPGAKSHLSLPVSHMGLLASARVAREVGSFLEHGRFGL